MVCERGRGDGLTGQYSPPSRFAYLNRPSRLSHEEQRPSSLHAVDLASVDGPIEGVIESYSAVSLRAVLVLTLLVAGFLAYATRRYRSIKAASMAIDDAGGTFGYSLDGPEWLRDWGDDDQFLINPGRITLRTSTGQASADEINNELCTALIPHINQFTRFQTLDLRTVDISKKGPVKLRELPSLTTLRPGSRRLTNAAIRNLSTNWNG